MDEGHSHGRSEMALDESAICSRWFSSKDMLPMCCRSMSCVVVVLYGGHCIVVLPRSGYFMPEALNLL